MAKAVNKTIRVLECALRAVKTGFPVGSAAANGYFIVGLLIVLSISATTVSANDRDSGNVSPGNITDSQQLKDSLGQNSSDKGSKESSKGPQPGKRNSSPRDVPVGAGETARPDWNMNSRMRNVDRVNRSFDGSMKNISNSIRKMNTDINKIRTLDRRDRRF